MGYVATFEGSNLRRNCYAIGSIDEADYPKQNAICKAETGLNRYTGNGSNQPSVGSYLRYQY